eukprot:5819031-Ditylum_brightwellii.AAC.1
MASISTASVKLVVSSWGKHASCPSAVWASTVARCACLAHLRTCTTLSVPSRKPENDRSISSDFHLHPTRPYRATMTESITI